ncbi:MAG: hypothetical protein KF897_05265 [Opitutaceae bacterium]|nr:hypothetical protein [Opitutaceae bacterium]
MAIHFNAETRKGESAESIPAFFRVSALPRFRDRFDLIAPLRTVSRFTFCLLSAASVALAALPPEYAAICESFQTQNPKGWSFTQTTSAEGRTLVERYDAAQPEFSRWTLIEENGRAPTEEEARTYREKFTRRSRGGSAPAIASQLELPTAELVSEDAAQAVYRFRLKVEDEDDKTANFLRANVTFHKATHSITCFELASVEVFAPVFGVKIRELRTAIHYHLPTADRPALLDKVTTRTRGRAFFKSLDADMLVTYTDYTWAGKMPTAK